MKSIFLTVAIASLAGLAGCSGSGSNAGSTQDGSATPDGTRDANRSDTVALDAAVATDGSSSRPDVPTVDRVVAACNNLGAMGVRQDITPPQFAQYPANPSAQLIVDPVHSGTMYLGTCATDGMTANLGAGIWKTTDCGATWMKVNTGRLGSDLDHGCQWSHAIDPIDTETIYFNAGYGTSSLYKSTNGGVDWDIVWPPPNNHAIATQSTGFVGDFKIDPYDHHHLFLSFHDTCGTFTDQIGCFAESTDSGDTWRLIFGTPAFEPQVHVYVLENSHTWLAASHDALWRTTDSGATWTSVTDGTISFNDHSAGNLYHASTGAFYYGTEYAIYRSPDGITWSHVSDEQWTADIIESQTMLFASGVSFVSSPLSDGMNWSLFPNFGALMKGATLGYDPDHHLLYGTNLGDGVFRMVVP